MTAVWDQERAFPFGTLRSPPARTSSGWSKRMLGPHDVSSKGTANSSLGEIPGAEVVDDLAR